MFRMTDARCRAGMFVAVVLVLLGCVFAATVLPPVIGVG